MSKVNQKYDLEYNEQDGRHHPNGNSSYRNKEVGSQQTLYIWKPLSLPREKIKFEPSGMKKKATTRPMTKSHLKSQNPFWRYDLGSLLLRTHTIITVKRKKKQATPMQILYAAK